jgi:hypothetical protein
VGLGGEYSLRRLSLVWCFTTELDGTSGDSAVPGIYNRGHAVPGINNRGQLEGPCCQCSRGGILSPCFEGLNPWVCCHGEAVRISQGALVRGPLRMTL